MKDVPITMRGLLPCYLTLSDYPDSNGIHMQSFRGEILAVLYHLLSDSSTYILSSELFNPLPRLRDQIHWFIEIL